MDRGVEKRNQRQIKERAAKEKRDEQSQVSTRHVRMFEKYLGRFEKHLSK